MGAKVHPIYRLNVRTSREQTEWIEFEVFTAVTMKNAVLWDVVPCRYCKYGRFEGKCRLYLQGRKNICERGQVLDISLLTNVPPNRRFLQDPHGATSQKTAFFMTG
jgi:hypothetical protein